MCIFAFVQIGKTVVIKLNKVSVSPRLKNFWFKILGCIFQEEV